MKLNPIFAGVLTLFLFSSLSCAGGKDNGHSFVQNAPFTLGPVFYQEWVAGVQEAGSGINVHITIDSYVDDVVIMNVYFRNKQVKAQNSPQYRDQYVGYFKNDARPDIIMDSDPVKESQNTSLAKFPFQLEEDEAVLSYLHNEEVKYLKISSLERKPMLAYPSTNPNGIDK